MVLNGLLFEEPHRRDYFWGSEISELSRKVTHSVMDPLNVGNLMSGNFRGCEFSWTVWLFKEFCKLFDLELTINSAVLNAQNICFQNQKCAKSDSVAFMRCLISTILLWLSLLVINVTNLVRLPLITERFAFKVLTVSSSWDMVEWILIRWFNYWFNCSDMIMYVPTMVEA